MSGEHIRIRIQMDKFSSNSDVDLVVPIDWFTVNEVLPPLKLDTGNSVFGAIFRTDPEVAKRVMAKRAGFAEMVSRDVAKALMKAFGAKDTIDGYSREEWNRLHAPDAPNERSESRRKK